MRARELTLLLEGNVEVVGRIVRSSNAAFVIEVSAGEDSGWAVYKPEAGEKPLFDFEPGLYRRERAAFLLSEHLGWDLVPFTLIREDAPLGIGSSQWFIDGDVREHYFTLYDEVPETHSTLAQLALFDCIANNADRKSGHVLRGLDGRVWGIDHRLCFSSDFKLRTVIWEFAGDPMAKPPLEDIPHSPTPCLRRSPNCWTLSRPLHCAAGCSICCAKARCRWIAPACGSRGRWFNGWRQGDLEGAKPITGKCRRASSRHRLR